jgi:hypothetical protein
MQIQKMVLCCMLVSFAIACERKPFVEHKIKMEPTARPCSQLQEAFRLNSNFGGERFEFEKCLPDGYTEKSITTARKGDTVVVAFNAAKNDKQSVYGITLDIDSYPAYHFITIDNETYSLSPTAK